MPKRCGFTAIDVCDASEEEEESSKPAPCLSACREGMAGPREEVSWQCHGGNVSIIQGQRLGCPMYTQQTHTRGTHARSGSVPYLHSGDGRQVHWVGSLHLGTKGCRFEDAATAHAAACWLAIMAP